MPQYKIMIARPCTEGKIHQSVCNFVSHCWRARFLDPDLKGLIAEIIDVPIDRFPTDIARNQIVQVAREHAVDFCFMIDSDANPNHEFFKSAILFLKEQNKPSIIGCPYMGGDGDVMVFRFQPEHSSDPQQPCWRIRRFPREEAFAKKGIERVASIGTHTICYDVRLFDQLEKPYFRYAYNSDHTQIMETEECYCHRHAFQQDIPIYCDWDKWSGHYKTIEVGPLEPLQPEQLPNFWKQRAKEYFLYHKDGQRELQQVNQGEPVSQNLPEDTIPHDVHGWLNDPEWYTRTISQIPDGGQFVEIGTWQGKSIIHASRQAKLQGKNITLFTIDTFEGTNDEGVHKHLIANLPKSLLETAQDNIKRYNCDNVRVIKGYSDRVAEMFGDESVDVVFLDAGHSYGAVYADIMAWLPKLKKGGILAGDDYHPHEFPGVVKAVTELLPNHTVSGRTWEIVK